MSIYDGVVTLDQTDVPVIVELSDDFVRLSASGTEIGHWNAEECHIAHIGDSAYSITAEEETLHFVPNQPSLFAAAVNGGVSSVVPLRAETVEESVRVASGPAETVSQPTTETGATTADPPKPLTMGLFYALCLTTAALAIWALISIAL